MAISGPMRVVSIGECMIELSGRDGASWQQGFAGDTLNTLWYLRALLPADSTVDYVTAFGDDPFSAEQIAFLKRNNIGTAQSPIIGGKVPGLYAITLDAHGERSFTYWRNQAAARHLADDPAALAASLADANLIYFSGITLAILEDSARASLFAALADARRAGTMIAFDPNYRPRLWPSRDAAQTVINRAYAVSTITLPTFDDEAALFGDLSAENTAARISKHGPETIIVKSGADAALLRHDGATEPIAPEQAVVPVDTTGAGDSFNGAFLAALLTGSLPSDATRFAHRIAGQVIGHHGALMPMRAVAGTRLDQQADTGPQQPFP